MKRSSALIGTAAAAAVLVAGSVAALSAINTAAASAPSIESIAVVDDQPIAAGGLVPIDIAPLPEIMPVTAAAPVVAEVGTSTPAGSGSSAKSGDAAAKPQAPSLAAPNAQVARSLTAAQASDIVTGQVTGSATVTDVSRTQHDGYDSWAVTIDKADGSRLVGYVFTGATGADVFDWKVLKEPKPIVVSAPAAKAPATTKPSKAGYNDDDDKYESEHHESHEGDDDDD
jgi:hypothetical protein